MAFAIDTNIIIHLLKNTPAVVSRYDEQMANGTPIIIPPYVDFEIRRGLKYANATAKMQMYQRLCDSCEIGEMHRETWVYAADLYSELRHRKFTVSDADLLIAAFCVTDAHTLVTNNTKDFEKFSELELADWV